MDTLSHSMIGLALSRFDGVSDLGMVGVVTLVGASNLPDVDVVTRLFGSTYYLKHHRGITHGAAVLPFLTAAFAGALVLFWPAAREVGFWRIFGLALLAVAIHILCDLLTPYGTKIWLPFHHHAVTTSSMPIFEPVVLLLSGLLLYLSYVHKDWANHLGWAVLLLWTFAFGLYYYTKQVADRLLLRNAENLGEVERCDTFPVPGMPLVWLCVIKRKKSHETFCVNILTRRAKRREVHPLAHFPESLKHQPLAKLFFKFARYPHVEFSRDGDKRIYTIRDMRFNFPFKRVFARGRVVTDAKGHLLEESFKL